MVPTHSKNGRSRPSSPGRAGGLSKNTGVAAVGIMVTFSPIPKNSSMSSAVVCETATIRSARRSAAGNAIRR